MAVRSRLLLLTPLLAVCLVLPAHAARLALVIGNADYTMGKLKNPVNDARAMDAKLAALGFTVQRVENLKRNQIGRTLNSFAANIKPGDDVVVFYAGHGVQVKGVNYLPAVDADIQSEDDVPLYSLNLDSLMGRLDESKARLKLLFLDACRNNPFARSLRSGTRGLARVESAPSGTLIHFATRPGSVAADGAGANGLYTTQLLRRLGTAGMPLELMLKQVATDVENASQGQQEPWTEGSIRGEFYFNPGTPGMAPAALDARSAAKEEQEEQQRENRRLAALVEALPKPVPGMRLPQTRSGIPLMDWRMAKGLQERSTATQILAMQTAYRRDAEAGDLVAQLSLANVLFYAYNSEKNFPEAQAWLVKAAQAGLAAAQTRLGFLTAGGVAGVTKDRAAALEWFRKAAAQHEPEAQVKLGQVYVFGQFDVPKDPVEALRWFRLAADQGEPTGTFFVGMSYLEGSGTGKDVEQGLSWLRKAAELGQPRAQRTLGTLYLTGDRLTKDVGLGIQWLRKAAEAGDYEAQYMLGGLYQVGEGVPKDGTQAQAWYQKSAEQGYFLAQYNLGVLYQFGGLIPKSGPDAVKWYTKAAAQGYAGAQINLGVMYLNGDGVPKDESEAARMFLKASELGVAAAQHNLAGLYKDGRGVPKDLNQAASLYRKAADQGYASSQYMLGLFYRLGWGVEKNEDQARVWIRKAADQGFAP